MFISHRYKFILFPDPMGACPWIKSALQPWLDQPVAANRRASGTTLLFHGMAPMEAAIAFDFLGYSFEDYTRVAIIRNPYAKMTALFDRISQTDPLWRMRRKSGIRPAEFNQWLARTRPDGFGAGGALGPRWRRFGAWSAQAWCGNYIDHIVRAETAQQDLSKICSGAGLSPAFAHLGARKVNQHTADHRYTRQSSDLIQQRYPWDLALYGNPPCDLLQAA